MQQSSASAPRIELMPDEQLERLYPQLVAIVAVKLKLGESYKQRIDAVRGTVLNPMTRDEVVGKCRDLHGSVPGRNASDRARRCGFQY
jgi:2-methylcitrate dehydratase PrpD